MPSVNVDPSGGISLRGNSGVTVLINGKPSILAANQGLDQLPASSVEKVEVITNPSARYQAAGTAGIINIVLKRNKLKGFSGSFQATAGLPADHSATANLNYKNERFNVFGRLGGRFSNFYGESINQQVTTTGAGQTILNQINDEERNDKAWNFYLGGDYYADSNNTFTLSFFHNTLQNTDVSLLHYDYSRANQQDSIVRRDLNYTEPQKYNQLELGYRRTFKDKRQFWSVDFQYDFWNDDENENLGVVQIEPSSEELSRFRTRDIESSKDFLLQSDFTLPIGKEGRIEMGLRGENRIITSKYIAEENQLGTWEIFNGIDNDLDYSERIGGAYVQFANSFKKFGYQLGLRTELTQIQISDVQETFSSEKNYARLFPTAHLSYGLSQSASVQVSYSRRIRRPGFWQLNPFGGYSDNTSVRVGNPDLDPAYTNSFELAFLQSSQKLTFNPSVYFQRTSDYFQFFLSENPGQGFTIKPINLPFENRYGTELVLTYSPAKFLQLNAEFNYYRFTQEGEHEGQNLDFANGTWFAQASARLRIPGNCLFQARFGYEARNESAQLVRLSVYRLGLSLNKRILKGKGGITLNVRNALNSDRRRSQVTADTYFISANTARIGRRFQVAFDYRFNQSGNQRDRRPGGRNR